MSVFAKVASGTFFGRMRSDIDFCNNSLGNHFRVKDDKNFYENVSSTGLLERLMRVKVRKAKKELYGPEE